MRVFSDWPGLLARVGAAGVPSGLLVSPSADGPVARTVQLKSRIFCGLPASAATHNQTCLSSRLRGLRQGCGPGWAFPCSGALTLRSGGRALWGGRGLAGGQESWTLVSQPLASGWLSGVRRVGPGEGRISVQHPGGEIAGPDRSSLAASGERWDARRTPGGPGGGAWARAGRWEPQAAGAVGGFWAAGRGSCGWRIAGRGLLRLAGERGAGSGAWGLFGARRSRELPLESRVSSATR